MPKLKIDLNIGPMQHPHSHGTHVKHGDVLHETVSPDYKGLADILGVSQYLGKKGYGIYAIVDAEGHIAVSAGHGEDVYYHTDSTGRKGHGEANASFRGIELISRVMLDYKTRTARIRAWLHRDKQLNALAKLIACTARRDGWQILDNQGDTTQHGVTTHYEVTMFYDVPGGHVDCWPSHKGGYFPKRVVLKLARRYYNLGWRF